MTDDEVGAEITKLMAETARINAETVRLQAEMRNLRADRNPVYAETRKLEREARWFPMIAFSGAVAAAVAILTLAAGFLKFLAWLKP